jgi:hypothetical protein
MKLKEKQISFFNFLKFRFIEIGDKIFELFINNITGWKNLSWL